MKNLILILITFIMVVFVSCDTSSPLSVDSFESSSSTDIDSFESSSNTDINTIIGGEIYSNSNTDILYSYGEHDDIIPVYGSMSDTSYITLNVSDINSHIIETDDTLAIIIENLNSLDSIMKSKLIIKINYNTDDTSSVKSSVELPHRPIIVSDGSKLYTIPINSLPSDTITNLTSITIVFFDYDTKIKFKLKKILLFQKTPI